MLVRLLVVLGIVTAVLVLAAWYRRRDGAVRAGDGRFTRDQLASVGLDRIAGAGGALLLGSPTCAPCVTVQRILDELQAVRPAFRWVYVDAADHLDLADAHRVLRVPTLFVLDDGGRILARTSGIPARRDLERVLDREGSLEPKWGEARTPWKA